MTGTADTEAYEFQQIYGLEVVVIPTHRPMIRKDHPDLVFLKREAKFKAIIEDIQDCHKRGQPALVGTTSIEISEYLSKLLHKEKIPHEVLNAKQHEREAYIVAQAGRPGAVTIATNMAGRGTDIVLGGNLDAELKALPAETPAAEYEVVRTAWKRRHEQVIAAGGLHIIGTERHESRRIDNQLRGRSGRQGDPGSSRFYLSLEDNLMRIFAPDWVSKWMQLFGMKEDEALEDRLVTRQIERAQRKVEAHNFDIRKHLLEFDDVANDQRRVIYEQRNELLEAQDVSNTVADIRCDVVEEICRRFVPEESIDEQWDLAGLERAIEADLGVKVSLQRFAAEREEVSAATLWDETREAVDRHFREKEASFGSEQMRAIERFFMLQVVDSQWKEHLASMDYLRQGIHLRGYAQKQPKQEFKREAFELFGQMLDRVKTELISILARVRIRSEEEVAALEREQQQRQQKAALEFQHAELGGYGADEEAAQVQEAQAAQARAEVARAMPSAAGQAPVVRDLPKVGRNDPCPCGSGKKYKQCHGKLA
jgi:preprotein translocase subunit SecA